jgi:uncharacterized membrane protein YphA (DoxX/SURF4 family)
MMQQFFQNKIVRFILSAGVAVLLFWFCPHCLNKVILGAVLLTLLIFINAAEFFVRFNWLTHTSRILVGCLFIFSGFIKSNDPSGFAYKLEEYFDVFATDLANYHFLVWFFEALKSISLFLAIFICMTEVVLGFMLLIGVKVRLTLWLLLLQIVFFTFLTFYSACFDKVTHCGCFGDFIQLTPWESFGKDLALMILITVLWVGEVHIKPLFGTIISNLATVLIFMACVSFPLYAWYYLPPLDFRHFGPGDNLCQEMKPGPNFKPAKYENILVYRNKQSRQTQEFTEKNYPWQDTLHWEYADRRTRTLEKAVDEAKISDFNITDPESGENMTDSLLKNQDYYFLLIARELGEKKKDKYHPESSYLQVQGRINDFVALCDKDKKKFYGVTSAPSPEIGDFRHEVQAMYPFLSADQTLLKTMIRSNPGLILMKGCVVVANWPYHSLPSYNDLKEKYWKTGK